MRQLTDSAPSGPEIIWGNANPVRGFHPRLFTLFPFGEKTAGFTRPRQAKRGPRLFTLLPFGELTRVADPSPDGLRYLLFCAFPNPRLIETAE
jgi:hypothetical protein